MENKYSKEDLERLSNSSQDYLISKGVLHVGTCPKEFEKCNNNSDHLIFTLGTTLFPYKISKTNLQKLQRLGDLMGILYYKISQDKSFIHEALGRTIDADDFVKRLSHTYQRAITEPHAPQNIYFSIQRSDYMLHEEIVNGQLVETIQQVEVNMISCSFVNLSVKIPKYHRYLIRAFPHMYKEYDHENVCQTNSRIEGCRALANAHNAFVNMRKENNVHQPTMKYIIVIVVKLFEKNCVDLRGIEHTLLQHFGITARLYSFPQLAKCAHLNENFDFIINDYEEECIASIHYFRSSYVPDDFLSDADWDVRLMIEKSSAIKCPDLPSQLVGAKKVQQYLCEQNILERFFTEEEDKSVLEEIRSCFTGIYEVVRNGKDDFHISNAINHPECYLLKPQREGGGNMVYGEKMKSILQNGSSEELDAYVLMKKIMPRFDDNILIDNRRKPIFCKTVSEFGVYQDCLVVNGKFESNRNFGYLIRSKPSDVNDGGVVSGNACIDSFYVY